MSVVHVLAESLADVRVARDRLQGRQAVWWSTSPAVIERLRLDGEHAEWIEQFVTTDDADRCGFAALAAADLLRPGFRTLGRNLNWPRLDAFLTSRTYRLIAVLLWKNLTLNRWIENTDGARWIMGTPHLTPGTGEALAIDRFDTMFAFLAAAADRDGVEVVATERGSGAERLKEIDQPTFYTRVLSLLDTSPSQLVWRLWWVLLKGRALRIRGGGPTVFVANGNEAVREIVPHLLWRGCRVQRLPGFAKLTPEETGGAVPDATAIAQALRAQEDAPLSDKETACIAKAVWERLAVTAKLLAPARKQATIQGDQILDAGNAHVVLANGLHSLAQRAFAAELTSRGGATAIAQHGVSAGIPAYHSAFRHIGENMSGQAYLVCADKAARFFEGVGDYSDVSYPVIGLPKMTRQVPLRALQRFIVRRQLRARSGDRVVMYVTSAGQNNMIQQPFMAIDSQVHQRIRTVTHQVLPKVQGIPVVKFYSTARFIDPDPFLDYLKPPPPVVSLKAGDFRFLRAGADLLVLEAAFSTLGWALGSDVPVVFLYDPGLPILPDAREALFKAVSVVSMEDSNWSDTLLDRLNRSRREIRDEWAATAAARKAFVDDYVFGPENPGRRGADAVISLVADA